MRELLIKQVDNNEYIYLIESNHLVEQYVQNINNQTIEGNIYVGKVQNVINGLQAAFIDLGIPKKAFIHLKDILPKVNILEDESIDYENLKITDYIKSGEPIIVEVKRDSTESKGPRLSTHINFKGRFIAYMPNANFITVSQKITDPKKREELTAIVKKYLPKGTGAIIRTISENATEEQIKQDIEYLVNRWNKVTAQKINSYPKLIYNAGGMIRKTIVDIIDYGIDRIVINNKTLEEKLNKILEELNMTVPIEITEDDIDDMYDIRKEKELVEKRKIWLDNGAFITIEKTEALTVIDVNSGKFVGKNKVEDTIFQVNKEATIEIARQLRLRDIGGIVVIDFIDMPNMETKQKLREIIKQEALKDRSKVQIEEFTRLDLLELTRKHICGKA